MAYGGYGGGGNGGWTRSSALQDNAGTAGLTNTGGGGGAAPNDTTGNNVNSYGKNGGSGIVIIRYANYGEIDASKLCITRKGNANG